MKIRISTSLLTAIAIGISIGSFCVQKITAAEIEDQDNHQQSETKMENKAAEIGKKLDELEQKIKTTKNEAKEDMSREMEELREM